jgi:uncharacterized protein (DUF1501 family)
VSPACGTTRRDFLRASLAGTLGLSLPLLFQRAALAAERERVLVVVELAGGNDGLNTVVPVRDDHYRRLRPTLALAREQTLRLDDGFGLHPRAIGLANLFGAGRLAVVHGCGYPEPDRSHFTALRYWHTAAPHRGEERGFLGRAADALWPAGREAALVGLGEQESLALRSHGQGAIVFADPAQYQRRGEPGAGALYQRLVEAGASRRDTLAFVREVARVAADSSGRVREACARYQTPVSYGASFPTISRDLRNVAALLDAGFPARVYYLSFSGFDTHGAQRERQQLLLQYAADALEGFSRDLDRIGRANEVLVLAFSEFGRRVAENASGGTDHGAAGPMFLAGAPVVGGLHGTPPDLGDLDDGDLRFSTDFRRVYATALAWLGAPPADVLGPGFAPLPLLSA